MNGWLFLNAFKSNQKSLNEVLEKDIIITFGRGILTIVILRSVFSLKLQY